MMIFKSVLYRRNGTKRWDIGPNYLRRWKVAWEFEISLTGIRVTAFENWIMIIISEFREFCTLVLFCRCMQLRAFSTVQLVGLKSTRLHLVRM